MLVMMRYKFGHGPASRQAYERFARWTPPDGFEIKSGWTSANNHGGYLLLEVADTERLLEFSAQFRDVNDELDVMPVVDLGTGVATVNKAYAWLDTL